MSYFDAVYMDHELSPRAKMVCMYLRDRANREGESWYAIGTIASDLGLSRSHCEARSWRSCPSGARREAAEVPKKRWMYLQPLSAAVKNERNPHQEGIALVCWIGGRVIKAQPEGPIEGTVIVRG